MSTATCSARRSRFPWLLAWLVAIAPSLQASDPGFPGRMLDAYLDGRTAEVWTHAGAMLRELAESEQGLREAAAEMAAGFGPVVAVLHEQDFDHPEGGGARVHLRVARHANVPEMVWVVTYFPAERTVQMIMPQPRQTVRVLFPGVELP